MLGIIINPKSGKSAYRRQRLYLFNLLKKRHQPFTYRVTKYASHATELAQELVENGYDELLVLGGDGTLSEVIDGIMHSNVPDKSRIRFGLMPRGTGNDWGRYWHLNKDYKHSLDIFFNQGRRQQVDVGRISFFRAGRKVEHYFINSVGFGVDALTCRKAQTMKYYVGSHGLNYFFGLLAALMSHKATPVQLVTDNGIEINTPMFTMNIGNGPFSGGGIRQNPEADPTDGMFHAMFVAKPTLKQILKAIPNLFNGKLKDIGFINNYTARKVTINTRQHLLLEKDGILIDACGPFEITLLPSALQMIVEQNL